jgi:hypothetical protein
MAAAISARTTRQRCSATWRSAASAERSAGERPPVAGVLVPAGGAVPVGAPFLAAFAAALASFLASLASSLLEAISTAYTQALVLSGSYGVSTAGPRLPQANYPVVILFGRRFGLSWAPGEHHLKG